MVNICQRPGTDTISGFNFSFPIVNSHKVKLDSQMLKRLSVSSLIFNVFVVPHSGSIVFVLASTVSTDFKDSVSDSWSNG